MSKRPFGTTVSICLIRNFKFENQCLSNIDYLTSNLAKIKFINMAFKYLN